MKILEVLPESQPEQTIILFHGYGADAYDLRSLCEVFSPGRPTQYLFPQGILEVPIGPGWTGRAWWPIDVQALQMAAMSGTPRDLSNERHPSLPELRKKIFTEIEKIKVPWNQIILGGFSQGAMLATDLFLNAAETPKGLIILSGALVNKEEWKTLAPKRAGSKYFMSHGKSDAVLSIRGASQLESLLNGAGLKGSLMNFQGGHEIPIEVIQKTNQYLKTL